MRSWLFLLLLLPQLLIVAELRAAEIRIVDQIGLTRAAKKVDGEASVQVEVHRTEKGRGSSVLLKNIDSPDIIIKGNPLGGGKYEFPSLSQGTWEVQATGKGVGIKSVRVN